MCPETFIRYVIFSAKSDTAHSLNVLTGVVRYMSLGKHVCMLQGIDSGTVCAGDAVSEGIEWFIGVRFGISGEYALGLVDFVFEDLFNSLGKTLAS